MRLYFIRHGQTDWNIAGRFQSRTDVPLNETGILQARQVRDLLDNRGIGFVRISTSPLGRARQTAEIIAKGRNAEIVIEPTFRELYVGEFEGREERALRAELGAKYDAWRANCFLDAAPGGESLLDVMQRVHEPILALASAELQNDQLVVAHQAVNAAMKAVLSGKKDPASLKEYMQANDEIDVWDPAGGELVERIKLSPRHG
ncbi:MAG: histidine phosphatase family protein [Pseudomonadota bacterium]|nr:histidine phosphatase family protein [Pseudomonadota bacterium]